MYEDLITKWRVNLEELTACSSSLEIIKYILLKKEKH
jgi:hypothetical protein